MSDHPIRTLTLGDGKYTITESVDGTGILEFKRYGSHWPGAPTGSNLIALLFEKVWENKRLVQVAKVLEWSGVRTSQDPDTRGEVFACCPVCGGIVHGEEWPGPPDDFGHTQECLYREQS